VSISIARSLFALALFLAAACPTFAAEIEISQIQPFELWMLDNVWGSPSVSSVAAVFSVSAVIDPTYSQGIWGNGNVGSSGPKDPPPVTEVGVSTESLGNTLISADPVASPEPAPEWMLVAGLAGLGGWRRARALMRNLFVCNKI
jgi:hypothetical protein